MASGFMRWQRNIVTGDAMGRAVRHMLNRGQSRGWHAWVEMWEDVLRKRAALRQGLGHLLNRKLSMGWGSWREMIAERERFLQLLRRGLSFMLNRNLALGFGGWRAAHELALARQRRAGNASRALRY